MFTTHFNSYVCAGDTITCQVGRVTYTATLEAVEDSHVNDADCYTKAQIAAWKNDEWSFFGVVISAKIDDVDLGDNLAALWSIEGNFPSRRKNPNTYFLEVANALLSEAMSEANKAIEHIRATLENV